MTATPKPIVLAIDTSTGLPAQVAESTKRFVKRFLRHNPSAILITLGANQAARVDTSEDTNVDKALSDIIQGGVTLEPLMEVIKNLQAQSVCVVSDMMMPMPKNTPKLPFIWVNTNPDNTSKPPFGALTTLAQN